MFYYKQVVNSEIVSVEAKNRPSISPGFVEATQAEYDAFMASLPEPEPEPLSPDEIRLAEIVATSPQVITMPEMWEAIRILAKR